MVLLTVFGVTDTDHLRWSVYRGYSNILLNMAFILSSEMENIYILEVAKPRMNF